jgi:hypothetical protein
MHPFLSVAGDLGGLGEPVPGWGVEPLPILRRVCRSNPSNDAKADDARLNQQNPSFIKKLSPTGASGALVRLDRRSLRATFHPCRVQQNMYGRRKQFWLNQFPDSLLDAHVRRPQLYDSPAIVHHDRRTFGDER